MIVRRAADTFGVYPGIDGPGKISILHYPSGFARVIVEPFTPVDPDPKVQAFVKKYKDQYGRNPDGWVAEMYDTVGMIHEAVIKAGKVDRQAIRDYVAGFKRGSGYKGILGEWYFGPEGNANFDLYKVKIKDGKKTILER